MTGEPLARTPDMLPGHLTEGTNVMTEEEIQAFS